MAPTTGRPTMNRIGVASAKEQTWESTTLANIQKSLEPGDEKKVLAIAMTSGEYVIADDYKTARSLFRKQFPHDGAYIVRADGSPVFRLPWRS